MPDRWGPNAVAGVAALVLLVGLGLVIGLPGRVALRAGMTVGVGVLVALIVLSIVRRRIPHTTLMPHNDVAGFVYATIAVIYSVVLGFMVVSAWQQFEAAEANANAEANTAFDLYVLAAGLPAAERAAVQATIRGYLQTVIADEWPAMAAGTAPSRQAEEQVDALWLAYQRAGQAGAEGPLVIEGIRRLGSMTDARRQRIEEQGGLLGIMWWALLVGGVTVVGFAYVFGVANGRVQAVLIGGLAATVTLILLLIYDLNQPFRGDVRVQPAAFELALERLPGGTAAVSRHDGAIGGSRSVAGDGHRPG